MILLSNFPVKGKPAVLPDRAVRNQSHYFRTISDCVGTVCELTLLPNKTAENLFLHKSGALRNVDGIFIVGAPAWR